MQELALQRLAFFFTGNGLETIRNCKKSKTSRKGVDKQKNLLYNRQAVNIPKTVGVEPKGTEMDRTLSGLPRKMFYKDAVIV